jgi:hypothetical protein
MQIIKSLFKLFVFVCPFTSFSQSTYLNQGAKEYHLLDRLEIKQRINPDLNFSTLKPYNRKPIVKQAELIDSTRMISPDSLSEKQLKRTGLSKVDEYNLRSLYMNNSEWVTGSREDFESKRPFLKTFYKTKANLLEVNTKDFFLAVNPILQLQAGKESDNSESLFLNKRGISVRGRIANKIGFSSLITENQERGPAYFLERVNTFRAVPGTGFYKNFKGTGVDYFDARGYFTFNATKYIDFQLGYDKNFIGNGYRSLFLSDWGNSHLFAKINTRIWKINFQNLFMELMPQFKKSGDDLLPRKYAAMHHLSMNVTKWLNVGLFEGVIFGRQDHIDLQYLNPIIFYRHIEGTVGSPDNAVAGLDFKANVVNRLQFYGQFLLDEFVLKQLKEDPTNWVNKFGIQAGVKYIDAFGLKNLDLQLESNRVRPFTYTHNDTIANYTHYNQPLAHPLGANFQEVIGIVNYQPAPKWYIYARAIYYKQGRDTAGANFGANIFKDYRTRLSNTGFEVGGGRKSTCLNGLLQVSYEFKENLFFDIALQQRNLTLAAAADQNSTFFTAGVRLNIFRREYDY